jgi:hypothetical protein
LAEGACGLTWVVPVKGFGTALNSWAVCYPKNPRFEPGPIIDPNKIETAVLRLKQLVEKYPKTEAAEEAKKLIKIYED